MTVMDDSSMSDAENHELVLSYLRRVLAAATTLSQAEGEDNDMVDASSDDSPTYFIDQIAGYLLKACRPDVLASGIGNLPNLASHEEKIPLEGEDEDEEVDDHEYQHRRTDHLRQLLRILAPVSLDVAAHVCSIVLSSTTSSDLGLPAFFLLSHWLPLAPHLTLMATEFFETLDFPWKESTSSSSQTEFLFVEACHNLCAFYMKRGEIATIQRLFDWNFVSDSIEKKDVEMLESAPMESSITSFLPTAIRWYGARIMGYLMDWKPSVIAIHLQRLELDDEQVPWIVHPWVLDQEEAAAQHLQLRGLAILWKSGHFPLPSSEQVRRDLPLHPWLVEVGREIILYRHRALIQSMENDESDGVGLNEAQPIHARRLIITSTTCRNLSLLGAALCQEPYPPPILVCGPHGSGKSSLVRELVHLCNPNIPLLEIHVDEETDSKTLIGSYTTTDIPGEFAWRAGALTNATREGQWVLLEDVDSVPSEIQAALVKLLEDRLVPLGNGKYERCHPSFRLFGTCTTASSTQRHLHNRDSLRIGSHRGGGKRILHPSLWRNVHVEPLPFSELKEIAASLYPYIPEIVAESSLSLLQALDSSGRTQTSRSDAVDHDSTTEEDMPTETAVVSGSWAGGRNASVRDFFKLLSRISNGICFERNVAYVTEAQRTLCLAESIDIFAGSCPDRARRQDFISKIAAPIWGITRDLALRYAETRRPTTLIGADFTEVGRAKIEVISQGEFSRVPSETFAQTNHALRLMESIGVCIRENEPVLLVGETGCGKTTLVQQLAGYCERELIVQNLSLQTDSTDLLGGYKPLELQHVARQVYREFVDLFVGTFSRKQNAQFLEYASAMREKSQWKKLSQCFQRAAKLGLSKVKEQSKSTEARKGRPTLKSWSQFEKTAERFERQRLACDAGLAFVFSEGALVDAIRSGKWVLLDEINLASSDTLQRLCGLLDDPSGSVTLTERGDAAAVERHPNFRLFAAMNPATDAGKKDLHASIRSRYSEIYVDELLDPVELRMVSARYLNGVLPTDGKPPEHTETIVSSVDVYLQCRDLAETVLADGGGHKPRYTLRTLTRALSAARNLVLEQRLPLARAVFEGFQLTFEGALDAPSVKALRKALTSLVGAGFKKSTMDHPGRKPGGRNDTDEYVLVKPFWIKTGSLEPVDWSEVSPSGRSRFILTPSMASSLRRLARAVAAGPWPVLLEGPTSAGKTTLVEYIAARCGHQVVRINNHEHTDVQEYTGSFASDSNGSLSFRDGILVRALKRGHWVILDELNLAPSEVLEALNRLLDDNRELYLAETNETVKPHPNFRLFATQNPCGAYGGRKPLSRAFRNRFVEIHMGDIPSDEMVTILEKRCACPLSHAKRLVEIMDTLRQRRSKSNVFLGKDSFITPRDLLRWAERESSSKHELAQEGFMLLAERLRSDEEKSLVREVIEEHFKVKMNMNDVYYGDDSEARKLLSQILNVNNCDDKFLSSIAPTRSLLRLISLVLRCIRQKEPVLLVGDTGCGKTTVVQFLSLVFNQKLYSVNCHATTETSDLIGGLRPVRGRDLLARRMLHKVKDLALRWPFKELLDDIDVPGFISLEIPSDPPRLDNDESEAEDSFGADAEVEAVTKMLSFARNVYKARPSRQSDKLEKEDEESRKRRKLSPSNPEDVEAVIASLAVVFNEIEDLGRRYSGLFEWSDGPLVQAMKSGQMLLLDEMSLAEDAVLERLNSVLEPSRTLVLAEKGDDGLLDDDTESRVIVSHESFRIFATMNPGGDFGKRELSPALRSRFTEIWVPAVTDRHDFELVLRRTLAGSVSVAPSVDSILDRMLAYIGWFNGTICGEPSSPCSDLVLTLRDMLSWARFIVDARHASKELTLWEAYCHGASLMHLDGLGLGSGLALEDAAVVQAKAMSLLASQVPPGENVSSFGEGRKEIGMHASRSFGSHPFFIPLGPLPILESSFNLVAPTTSLNMFRVLRAMQLSKPVLLEGSPGVGKTSLVTALAARSGHKLVRINLSEQTDISDLMGSDLPVQDSGTSGASFKWCDGVLLTAIKEGSWVLLDELNLASQSVLEGLNSCLDHRAAVYIPELGRTFECPPTFRIFAAQNPLAQGGGRKGLPKSFLNRFTKVYVDSLTDSDLRSIVASRHPSLEKNLVDKLIDFNTRVHFDVVEKREFGEAGSPWEFNLRDVFRWCELLETKSSDTATYARDLYLQRFRTREDRERLSTTYEDFFGSSISSPHPPKFHITETIVKIGDTALQRRVDGDCGRKNPLKVEPGIFLSLLQPMEAVARCIALKWPCLLVGSAGSGKTSVIASLADLCNITLVEQCLAPSSDVTELIGCFEQVDSTAEDRDTVKNLGIAASEFLLHGASNPESCRLVWELSDALARGLEKEAEADHSFLIPNTPIFSAAEKLSNILVSKVDEDPRFNSICGEIVKSSAASLTASLQRGGKGRKDGDTSHFVWRDGILVKAMAEGYWLHLENVNLCPSSVLDRLNSVMEKDGELLLSECGTQNGDDNGSGHRCIKPHPNFRVFLSMNPANGEISRAMRNRCVEISLLQPINAGSVSDAGCAGTKISRIMAQDTVVDSLNVLWRGGVRSYELAAAFLQSHLDQHQKSVSTGEEPPCISGMHGSAMMLSSLLARGISGNAALRNLLQLFLEVEESKAHDYLSGNIFAAVRTMQFTPLPTYTAVRAAWTSNSRLARVGWEARHLRIFMEQRPTISDIASSTELGLFDVKNKQPTLAARYKALEDSAGLSDDNDELLYQLLQVFLSKTGTVDMGATLSYFAGLDDSCSRALRQMASIMRKTNLHLNRKSTTTQVCGENSSAFASTPSDGIYIRLVQLSRLSHQLRERQWLYKMTKKHPLLSPSMQISVLEASFYIAEGRLDRSSVSCSVTPALYPFFLTLDEWISHMVDEFAFLEGTEEAHFSSLLREIFSHRDRLWRCMEVCHYLVQPCTFLSFDEAEFIVQWKWLKKSLSIFSTWCSGLSRSALEEKKRRLDLLMEAIDYAVFGTTGYVNSSNAVRKKMGMPLVPHKGVHWEAIHKLRGLAQDFTIASDVRFDPLGASKQSIELGELVELQHPVLFISQEDKVQLLAAISTAHWSSTDEMEGTKRSNCLAFAGDKAYTILQKSLDDKRQAFATALATAKIDSEIETVENQLGVEKLEELRDSADSLEASTAAYSQLSASLLNRFGYVQLSAIAEFWCILEESRIVSEIHRMLVEAEDDQRVSSEAISLLSSLKRFVGTVVSRTLWTIADMRPYQTLVWALESTSKGGSLKHLLRCLLPTMSCNLSRRVWTNSFSDLNAISTTMELPAMWIDDDRSSNHQESISVDVETMAFGPSRLRQQVRSEAAFRLIGEQFMGPNRQQKSKYYTMENHEARKLQSQELVDMFSTLGVPSSDLSPFGIHYLLIDVLNALKDSFPDAVGAELVTIARRPDILLNTSPDHIRDLGSTSTHAVLKGCFTILVLPLFVSLQRIWKRGTEEKEFYAEHYALAWIYVGLLRIHLLVPDSPLDPGRAPLAKVALINRELSSLHMRVAALRVDSGFVRGNFAPESDEVCQLLDEGENLVSKRDSQEKKVVERVESAPPFFDLFRETRDFVKSFAGQDTVLPLVETLQEARRKSMQNQARQRELNWQRTASAFCSRLESHFAAYEDITTTFVDAVRLVQNGLHMLAEAHVPVDDVKGPADSFDLFMRFPMGNHSEDLGCLVTAISSIAREDVALDSVEKQDCQQALALAALARLSIQKTLIGLDQSAVASCCTIFNVVTRSHLSKGVEDLKEIAGSEDEVQEREFREQFPDHHKEFSALLQSIDEREEMDETVKLEEAVQNIGTLSDENAFLLCAIHRELFADETTVLDDSTRTRAFCAAYSAAYLLETSFNFTKRPCAGSEGLAAHVMALSLSFRPNRYGINAPSEPSSGTDAMIDFHNDPNPIEAANAAKPLERLMARTTQLLTAFPGHSILLALGTICEKVRKFDLLIIPVGKVMTGLEVILKQAQEWEQHASERVKLGTALQETAQLVARWRKLQLQSWSRLMLARENRYVRKAQKHWIRLNGVLHDDSLTPAASTNHDPDRDNVLTISSLPQFTPRWVWKGLSPFSEKLSEALDTSRTDDLVELVKILDTFILTSPLGEFKERLALLKSFSNQIRSECYHSGDLPPWQLTQSRALVSLWSYYCQFIPLLSSKLDNLRRPIETRLNDEVKLAKWDEQSYYALADSTERNHRKLMKILSEYDRVLDMNVGLLIQQESCRGIRSDVDSHDEMCTSMPPQTSMFPISTDKKEDSAERHQKITLQMHLCGKQKWTDAGMLGVAPGSHPTKMRKYASKMESILGSSISNSRSWALAGTEEVTEFCDAIFERVESLRAKATRPMKERALVDLFRELKRNGFSNMKWSVPSEVRQMVHLLQLPNPIDMNSLGKSEKLCLEKGELYYNRCLSELNSFRSETKMLGSKYMGRREMDMMLGFSEHALLMLSQQRSLLANLVFDNADLRDYTTVISCDYDKLPASQTLLRTAAARFDRDHASAVESLRQVSLLVKSSQSLLERGKKSEWARDTIAILDSHLSTPSILLPTNRFGIVAEERLESIKGAFSMLKDVKKCVRDCRSNCVALGCIPSDAFDRCLSDIERALSAGSECIDARSKVEIKAKEIDTNEFTQSLSRAVEYTLLTVQGFSSASTVFSEDGEKVNEAEESDANVNRNSIWECHKEASKDWSSVNLKRLNAVLEDVLGKLVLIHDSASVGNGEREGCVGLAADLSVLASYVLKMSEAQLQDYLMLYKSTAKFNYVLLRIFRVLVSKGYCSDVAAEDGEGDGEGDISGMTFEDDKDGTGMGEGEGKNDVTDQLESEEQLLGLKGDEDEEAKNAESKQLNEDEAEQGMEMEGDFDGEMYDLPERPADDENEEEKDGEEELDREMGEDASPNEEVVDEKMWDDSDDENENDEAEEKFEKDSSMKGEAIEGETRTKEDEEDNKKAEESQQHDESAEAPPKKDEGGDVDSAAEEDHDINEDTEDKYEEKHGVDVRDDKVDEDNGPADEEEMQLDDDLQLDNEAEGEEDAMDEDQPENEEFDAEELAQDQEKEEGNEDDAAANADEEMDPIENSALPTGMGTVEIEDETKEDQEEEAEDEETENNPIDVPNQEAAAQEAHGIKSSDGKDAVLEEGKEDEGDEEGEPQGEEPTEGGGTGSSQMEPSGGGGGAGHDENEGARDESKDNTQKEETSDIPNPFKNPGDATKFWHRKLNMLDSNPDSGESMEQNEEVEEPQEKQDGEFEFTSADQSSSAQVLGEATEEEAVQLERQEDDDNGDKDQEQDEKPKKEKARDDKDTKRNDQGTSRQSKKSETAEEKTDEIEDSDNDSAASHTEDVDDQESHTSEDVPGDVDDDNAPRNQVVSDLSRLNVGDDGNAGEASKMDIVQDEQVSAISTAEVAEARSRWLQIQGDTHNLSRRLCEKLRLVMEPLVASKLRGDYRSGKRINMKRVIGYIASGYRKDKIWLRRTKPAKRNYRVLLAVDDSESMIKSGAGDMALRAMATLAVGMNQLEIGELGVASFGNEMRLVHPFHLPFTSESGANVVQNFKFDQQRTRTALCVESAMAALETSGDQASMQLIFLISDGRIERDSRAALKRLMREMIERNILLAMIIVEGKDKNSRKDSIVNMKEVTFEKGKPVVKRFIEDYPFPYYIVLDDMVALPEVLGDALRQWFEMLAQLQGNGV